MQHPDIIGAADVLLKLVAGVIVLRWFLRVELAWRTMLRGYLERRVGARLPEPIEHPRDQPGSVRFPEGDDSEVYRGYDAPRRRVRDAEETTG